MKYLLCLKHFLRAPTFFLSPKRGITPRKKIESDLPLHINSFITTKFHKILLSGFRGVALTNCFSSIFHFGQISKFKKSVTPRKKTNQNFLWICTSTHYVLQFHEVIRNSVERFQRGCADKKSRTDGLTDWLTDWGTDQKHYTSATRCMGYNKCSLTWECEFQ